MSAAVAAIIAENTVIALAIAARWSLLRQGGGLQVKTPPVPKKTPQPAPEPAGELPVDLDKRRAS